MNDVVSSLGARLSKLQEGYVVGARRSIGSFIQIYFDDSVPMGVRHSKGKSSVLVEFASWTIAIRGVGDINQDCDTKIIDQCLPRILGKKIKLVQFDGDAKLDVILDGARICLAPSLDGLPDDKAWIFFDDEKDGAVEAWTIMCDNEISHWAGKRPNVAS